MFIIVLNGNITKMSLIHLLRNTDVKLIHSRSFNLKKYSIILGLGQLNKPQLRIAFQNDVHESESKY